jgi:hypothetical protein
MGARVHERLFHAVAIDRGRRLMRVLLNDREQVAEQALLDRRQLGALDRRARGRMVNLVDGRPGADQRRRAVAVAIRRLLASRL